MLTDIFRIAALQEDVAISTYISAGQGIEMIRLKDALEQELAVNNGQPFMSATYFMRQNADWIMKHSGEYTLVILFFSIHLNCSCICILFSLHTSTQLPISTSPPPLPLVTYTC